MNVITLLSKWEWMIIAGGVGALWGSFANVVIVRWPRELSVVHPGSHCFSCNAPIRWYDNIPVLSYLLLRGRCRRCKALFSCRYALVEAAMAVLSALVFARTALAFPEAPVVGGMLYLQWFFFVWGLVTIAIIDLEHYLIPDAIAVPGIVVGVVANGFIPVLGWVEPLVAAIVSYAGLRLLFIDGYQLLTGKPGMGLGDAKLLAMIGAFVGYEGVLFTLFAGALQGTVVGIIMVLVRRRNGLDNEPVFEEEWDEDGGRSPVPDPRIGKARVPFGPFLALGAMEYYFIGHYFIDGYGQWITRLFLGG